MGLAGLFLLGASGAALAACSASGTTGINFDCVGTSVNTATVTNPGTNGSITGDDGNAAFMLAPGSDFTNSGDVTVEFTGVVNNTTGTSGFQRMRLYGIVANDAGDYTVTNTSAGVVTVNNPGVGRLWGVAGSGDVTNFVLNNDGTIAVTRGSITLGTVSATSLTAHAGALGNANLDVGAAAYSEEELTSLNIFNTGILRATGQLTAAIYSRAEDTTVVNSGTIETTTAGTGFAIGVVSDSGETRDFDLTNTGTITGDLLMVNGQAQRYFAISKGLGGALDTRLNINSQFGQLNSESQTAGRSPAISTTAMASTVSRTSREAPSPATSTSISRIRSSPAGPAISAPDALPSDRWWATRCSATRRRTSRAPTRLRSSPASVPDRRPRPPIR